MSPENVIHNISASYKAPKECLDGSSLMIYKKIIHLNYVFMVYLTIISVAQTVWCQMVG
jgi:hypothetical protein